MDKYIKYIVNELGLTEIEAEAMMQSHINDLDGLVDSEGAAILVLKNFNIKASDIDFDKIEEVNEGTRFKRYVNSRMKILFAEYKSKTTIPKDKLRIDLISFGRDIWKRFDIFLKLVSQDVPGTKSHPEKKKNNVSLFDITDKSNYTEKGICIDCNKEKNNINLTTGACYECDVKFNNL